jgi:hypothetical protein
MGFGDRDDRSSAEAHLRTKEQAKEMGQFTARTKELEAEDARRRGGILTSVRRFFSSKLRRSSNGLEIPMSDPNHIDLIQQIRLAEIEITALANKIEHAGDTIDRSEYRAIRRKQEEHRLHILKCRSALIANEGFRPDAYRTTQLNGLG